MTYLFSPFTGSTPSKSGKETRSAAAHRRQPSVVRADLGSGHRHEPAQRRRAHLRVNVARRLIASLSLSISAETRKGREWLGFSGERPTHCFVALRVTRCIDLRWTTHDVLGSIRPRWADKMLAQAFAAFWSYQWVVDQAASVFWAELV
jgi:hypothetical protein